MEEVTNPKPLPKRCLHMTNDLWKHSQKTSFSCQTTTGKNLGIPPKELPVLFGVHALSYCAVHLLLCSLKSKLRGMIVLPKNILIKISKSIENNSVFKSRQGHPTLKKAMFFSFFMLLIIYVLHCS